MQKIEPREYQLNILKTCKEKNTLVILPTGTGKTVIAILLARERLKQYPDSKVFVLAPTKPLVEQHKNTFAKFLEGEFDTTRFVVVTGDIKPEKRKELYRFGKIIFVTPQTLQNDLIEGRVSLHDVSLIVFDEAHRAVGKYPYVFIASVYLSQSRYPRVLALTASPGHDINRIKEVIENLGIEAVEIRVGYEKDIRKYIKPIKIERVDVFFDEKFKEIQTLLREALELRYNQLKELGIITRKLRSKKEIIKAQKELQKMLAEEPDNEKIKKSLSLLAEIMKIHHAIEVFETQTLYTFVKYLESLIFSGERKSQALKNVIEDPRIRKAYVLAKELLNQGKEHPKIFKLLEILKEYKDKKVIIFAQIKLTVDRILHFLYKDFKAEKFVGKSGMKKEKQAEVLKRFEKGEFNVLVATSIGEEGLDIPKVDLVVFYEPIPSEIRYIQRRGRTGRGEVGEVKILVTKNTLDEVHYWAAIIREKKMIENIRKIKKELLGEKEEKVTILDFVTVFKEHKPEPEPTYKLKIVADFREKDSGVIQELVKDKVFVELKDLEVGDYIVGDIIIERKTKQDFVNSLLEGRLFEQLEKLKEVEKPLLIIEGEEDIYSIRNVPPNLIRSVLLKITLEYKVPIIFTKNFRDTAQFIKLLAEKIKEEKKEEKEITFKKKEKSIEEIKKEILMAFPGIGPKLAEKLLEKFKTIKNIINAPLVELEKVLGETRARRFKEIIEK